MYQKRIKKVSVSEVYLKSKNNCIKSISINSCIKSVSTINCMKSVSKITCIKSVSTIYSVSKPYQKLLSVSKWYQFLVSQNCIKNYWCVKTKSKTPNFKSLKIASL